MKASVTQISVKGVMPTVNGSALFMGNDDKTFVVYIDHAMGMAINSAINGVKRERPLTHDLMLSMMQGLEAKLTRVVINHENEGVFYARIFLQMDNEVHKKIIELDARPTDSIILSLHLDTPIYVTNEVLDRIEDMSPILERVLKQQAEEGETT